MSCYPKLFSPLKVGNVTMKNRIETGPMSIVELDPKGCYTEQCLKNLSQSFHSYSVFASSLLFILAVRYITTQRSKKSTTEPASSA